MKYTKENESTLKVERAKMVPKPSDTEKEFTIYDYSFLLSQREAITAQRDEMIRLKQIELDEVNTFISEADKLGIKVAIKTNKEIV